MTIDATIKVLTGWFDTPGAYVLVDGQFGSTGKGLLAGFLAEYGQDKITHVTTNAGPNSGHTAYFDFWGTAVPDPALGQQGYEKIVTQQIPVASVFLERLGKSPTTLLNAGAVIDDGILAREVQQWFYDIDGKKRVVERLFVHPCAAVIDDEDREKDKRVVANIAGTGKGVGPAIARKVGRQGRLAYETYRPMLPANQPQRNWDNFWDWSQDRVFVETAQGFSLGLNTARFSPHVTSRECTVMQAISDARIPAQMVKKVVACFRTFPIRVGNTPTGSSGECYEDQTETTWEAVGVPAELTTVTKRVRRVFNWSRIQFKECIAANRPDVVFINFANYCDSVEFDLLLGIIRSDYRSVMGRMPEAILAGYGPYSSDIKRVG